MISPVTKLSGIFLFSLFFIISSLFPVLAETEYKKFRQARYIMGTVFQIEIYSSDEQKAKKVLRDAFEEIRRLDLVMSNYKAESELSFVVNNAWKKPVKVSSDLYEVLEKSIYYAELSGGMFDITIEPLVELWGFKSREYRKPSQKEIEATLQNIGYKNIILDRGYVYLQKKGIKIDPGAIGKGYAVDKAVEIIKNSGINSAMVDAVSNQYFIGNPPGQETWKVGIKDPGDEENIIRYLQIKDKAVSTSGDYEQFFIIDNKKYSHILNPKTGYPMEEASSATVISDNGADADALSTILLLLNDEQIKEIKKQKNFSAIKVHSKNNKLIVTDF